MDIVASFVPDREAAIAMEPGVRAFDDPATDPQAAAIRRSPARDSSAGAPGGLFNIAHIKIIAL